MNRTLDLRTGRTVWMAYRAPSVPVATLAGDALIPAKTARLSKKLARLFPKVDARAEFAWTGAFGRTSSGLPLIGKLPGQSRVHAVMGYGGNGITFSRIAAELVRSALTGMPDADARLFAFEA